jgi:hypothetical protein
MMILSLMVKIPSSFPPPFEKAIMYFLTQEGNRLESGKWGEK